MEFLTAGIQGRKRASTKSCFLFLFGFARARSLRHTQDGWRPHSRSVSPRSFAPMAPSLLDAGFEFWRRRRREDGSGGLLSARTSQGLLASSLPAR
ncbi:hypothetical protein F4780DRAFT_665108 [Xylariomycetidae sp. FL0641]|nr:hypothetical protein F4780DRAFT_665108 [Xylariomycetidae sp. FL0641]